MKNSLFILTEDLNNGVIQSQVLTHIDFLKKKRICNFILLVCYWRKNQIDESRKISHELEMKYGIRILFLKLLPPKLIFSNFINKKRITHLFAKKNHDIDYIHARTDFCAIIADDLKKKINAKLIWDCRGYAPAEVDYQGKTIINFLKKLFLAKRFSTACKISDKVIVVSSFLKNKINKFKKNNIFIVPSVASSSLFKFDIKKRNNLRKRLKINKNKIVFIYSGSLKKYQMFDETINFFKSLSKNSKNIILFVLTRDKIEAKEKVLGIKNIKIFSLNQSDVNNYLNAADFAIMFRKNDLTNKAASPTKFAEYCLTGLDVITNSTAQDYYFMKKEIQNIHNVKQFNFDLIKKQNRKKVSEFYRKRLSREAYVMTYSKIYE